MEARFFENVTWNCFWRDCVFFISLDQPELSLSGILDKRLLRMLNLPGKSIKNLYLYHSIKKPNVVTLCYYDFTLHDDTLDLSYMLHLGAIYPMGPTSSTWASLS
jgi:hypothetical protein